MLISISDLRKIYLMGEVSVRALDGVHGLFHGGIKSEGALQETQIVVNGLGNPHHRHVARPQRLGQGQGPLDRGLGQQHREFLAAEPAD